MKPNPRKITHRNCAHCGHRFLIDPRVRRHHRFCGRPACIKESRRVAQQKYLRKERCRQTPDKVDTIRVQEWRAAHPGYWRRKLRIGCYEVRGKLAYVVREFALQDMIDTHFSLVVGLVSYLAKTALQDTIASEIRRLMLLGHDVITRAETTSSPPSETKPS